MGAVDRATDTKLNRDVAIKGAAGRSGQRPRLSGTLNHPNIAIIHRVEGRSSSPAPPLLQKPL